MGQPSDPTAFLPIHVRIKMKKVLIGAIALLSVAGAFAQGVSPEIVPDFYLLKMSDNGKYLISEAVSELMEEYNRNNASYTPFQSCSRGLGNSMTDNGIIVGSMINDVPFIIRNEVMTIPAGLDDYAFCNFHGITADATRICGQVNNIKSGGSDDDNNMMYLPMYVDVNEKGEVSAPVILPTPIRDFVNLTPQYCTAVWISDDGHTILGQVIDNSGMMPYPIVYTEDSEGKWSYSLPAAHLLNPDNITLPAFPTEPVQPEPEDYMESDMLTKYLADVKAWEMSQYDPTLYPNPVDYMTPEKKLEYLKARQAYETEAMAYNRKLDSFFSARTRIFNSSAHFFQNAMAMSADGSTAAVSSFESTGNEQNSPKRFNMIVFDLKAGTSRTVTSGSRDFVPHNILADGTIAGSSTASGDLVSRGYLLKPGADTFTPIEDYLGEINPEYRKWMVDNLTFNAPVGTDDNGMTTYEDIIVSGNIYVSRDLTCVAGGVMAYVFPDRNDLYFTYVFDNLTTAIGEIGADSSESVIKSWSNGVIEFSAPVTGLSIVDMTGRTLVMQDSVDGSINTGLNNGVYVVSYTTGNTRKVEKIML